jgi:hypothetical protein
MCRTCTYKVGTQPTLIALSWLQLQWPLKIPCSRLSHMCTPMPQGKGWARQKNRPHTYVLGRFPVSSVPVTCPLHIPGQHVLPPQGFPRFYTSPSMVPLECWWFGGSGVF